MINEEQLKQLMEQYRWQYPLITAILTVAVAFFIVSQTQILPFFNTSIEATSKVIIEPRIVTLTDEELQYVGRYKVPDATKDDFRMFKVTFRVENGPNVLSRKVDIFQGEIERVEWFYGWRELMSGIDGVDRYWSGGGHYQDNESEDFAEYYYDFVLYSKGLSEEQLRKAFNQVVFKVTLTGEEEQVVKEYPLGDYIEFVE